MAVGEQPEDDPPGGHRRRRSSPPRPQLTEHELRHLLRLGLIGLALVEIVYGAGYLLGAPATSPSLRFMTEASEVPMPVWGAVLVVAGVAVLARFYVVGFTLAGLVFGLIAVFAVLVLPTGNATGWGWPTTLGYAVINFAAAWIRGRLNERSKAR